MKCGHDSHWSQHIHNVALLHSFDVANLYVHVEHSTFTKTMMPGPCITSSNISFTSNPYSLWKLCILQHDVSERTIDRREHFVARCELAVC